jgi:glycosyltransferase involved in cell wall biosynthesis
VYRNEASVPDLLAACAALDRELGGRLEVVFVVDGSPDRSFELLRAALPREPFRSQLLLLSRNFGAFPATRAGLAHARGSYFAVVAADLQEPPELALTFFRTLEQGQVDVTLGTRTGRGDPLLTRVPASLFWGLYRRFVQRDMPPGGVDVFGCTRPVRDALLALRESHTSLVGLLLWLGFRRALVGYERRPRAHGRSAWTFKKKLRYLSDSVFCFTDFPIRVLIVAGALGLAASGGLGLAVLASRLFGLINVPGYAATILVITFFAALNSFGLGVVGSYVWRTFENTKRRPDAVVALRHEHGGTAHGG